MHIQSSRGFTLIELLVVIAIIGILSAVVLGSLNSARSKGNDAAVKSNLNNARAQAELFYDANTQSYVGTYNSASDVCYPGASVNGIKGINGFGAAAAQVSGVTLYTTYTLSGGLGKATCHAIKPGDGFPASGGWAMEVPLKGSYPGITNPFYCVDSNGTSTTTDGSTLAGSDAKCN